MNDFWAAFENFFWKMWNELYKYLSEVFGTEVDDNLLVPVED